MMAQNVYNYVRMCAIVMENQRQSINGANIGQLVTRLKLKLKSEVNGNTRKESCAEHALIGIPTILKHRIRGISNDGQHRESDTSGIGNNWKADDGLRRRSTDDR